METTSRGRAAAPSGEHDERRYDPRSVDGYLLADFPWYGLDEAFTGPRWLTQVGLRRRRHRRTRLAWATATSRR